MFGYFITGFAGVFWLLRVIVTLMFTSETPFPIVPLNPMFEIVVLFITFMCIILIAKRNMLGAIIYLITHCAYFGIDAYKTLEVIIEGQPETANYLSLFISIIAVIVPLLAVMNIGLSSGKGKKDKETDWFYGSKEYERNFDDRADTNQYKF